MVSSSKDQACISNNNNKKRKRPAHEDPMSHRIVEKRRRDRMNSCLADLSRLIPTSYLSKGRGRVEKTEIIEMAIKHITDLQQLQSDTPPDSPESHRAGYRECQEDILNYMSAQE